MTGANFGTSGLGINAEIIGIKSAYQLYETKTLEQTG
jgi:hypothetical protein